MSKLPQNGIKQTSEVFSNEAKEVQDHEFKHGLVLGRTNSDNALRGRIIRLSHLAVGFEIYEAKAVLQISEVLTSLKIFLDGREVYSGRAVICNLFQSPAFTICEIKLDKPGVYVGINMPINGNISFLDAYKSFFGKWQKQTKLLPEFKLAVLDIQSYLQEVKLLMEQIEISFVTHPSQTCSECERQVLLDLSPPFLKSIDAMRERLLDAAEKIEPDLQIAHQVFLQRQLHPFFLCSPFGHRTFHKPLGYAGDYEIMNMIYRNTFEGESLYAKLVHYWLVNQAPAKSVRNRVAHMKTKLVQETARTLREKRSTRILNVGCGPAREIQDFVFEQTLANHAEFILLDFDAETLNYANKKLDEIIRQKARTTKIQVLQTSVIKIINDSCHSSRRLIGGKFDLIYCGGLFDYLSDKVCKQLISFFYEYLAPGGLMVVANMTDNIPYRRMLEFLLDWHLIYRDAHRLSSLVSEKALAENRFLSSEAVGANIFLELRKPESN